MNLTILTEMKETFRKIEFVFSEIENTYIHTRV